MANQFDGTVKVAPARRWPHWVGALMVAATAAFGTADASAQSQPAFFVARGCTGCHGPDLTQTHTSGSYSWSYTGAGGDGLRAQAQTLTGLKNYFAARVAVLVAPHEMITFQTDANSTTPSLWTDLRQYVFDLFDGYVESSTASGAPISPISPSTIGFGSVGPGLTSQVTFTIKTARATWNAPAYTQQDGMRISSVSLGATTGSGSGSFSVGTPSCTELLASYGNGCTVTVTYNAGTLAGATAGTKSSTLNISFTDPYSGVSVNSRAIPLTGTTVQATVSRSPTTLSQSSPVGVATTSGNVTITNSSGSVSLRLEDMTSASVFSNTHAADYSVTTGTTNSCTLAGHTLAPGQTCNVRIVSTPGGAGNRVGTFTIPSNASNNVTVSLTGFGETRTVSASPSSLDFGSVLQGAASTSSGVNFTLTNSGNSTINAPTLAVSDTAVGDTASDFTRNGGTCGTVGFTTLAAGATCTAYITFRPATSPVLQPAATSARAATVTFTSSNATNSPITRRVTGTSVGLQNPTAPAPAAFPSTLVGTTSGTTRTITITNPRANPVTYSLAALTGTNPGDFAVTAESCAPGRSVAGGGACTVTYSFTPALALTNNTRNANANINFTPSGTDPTPPALAVALSGPATTAASFAINSTSLTLASVVNIAASPVTLTVTNNGTAALVLSGLSLAGANPGDYSLGGTCTGSSSLAGTLSAPRTSCTITVTFTPGAEGARNATLTIGHNDGTVNGGSTVVTLNGTGNASLTPVLDIGGTSQLPFGNVLQGGSSQTSFTIRNGNTNSGATALQMSGLAINGAAASDYALGGTCAGTTSLASNASCTVTVTFAPSAAGARSATLAISTTNAGSANVTLSGTGVALADATLTGVPLAAFPSTLVNTTSTTTGTVTVNNPRANSITYGTAFGGTNAADFQIGSESCATRVVPAGGSCTVAVRFAPANGAEGIRSASLVLAFIGFGTDPNPATLSTPVTGTAALPAPAFSISSSNLSFTAVVLSPTTGSALVTNTGTANLALTGLAFSGAQASDFALDSSNTCTASTTLAPSNSCTLVLRYDPAAAGPGSAALAITSNAAGSPHSVTLSGTATPTPRPRISLSSLALSFGSLQVGTPASQIITVQNAGDATLTFSGLVVSGAASSDFSRSGSCAISSPLAPAAQCDITVTFNPSAAGARNASLAISSDASNGTASVSLSGTGVPVPAPVVTLSSLAGLPLDFGSQTIGGLYPSRRVTLSNTGNADLVTSAVTVEGSGFSNASATSCPATLTAGASCDIDIAFAPAAAATDYNGLVRVVSNAAGSPHTAALHGRGVATAVPSVVWEPLVSRMDFGQVDAGSVSAVQSATLRNSGPGGLRLTVLNAVGPDASAFSVTAGTCQIGETLFEGQTCRIDVRFAPGTSGTKTANVQVASSGSFPSDLTLTGVGMGGPSPGLALSLRTMAFGTVRVGTQSVPSELTLSANGSGVVRVTGLLVSDGWTVQAKSCPALPFTLQAGSECTLTLVFAPRAAAAATGQLTVSSDATNGTSQQVALSGTGEAQPDLSSGGCSISQSNDPGVDPTLALLALLALTGLVHRRRLRAQATRGTK